MSQLIAYLWPCGVVTRNTWEIKINGTITEVSAIGIDDIFIPEDIIIPL
ncbi:hypothetical protein N018_12465 [Pseudomonas syringae CC1557]|uniref:Uncharacterized protein n=1 Tax=Pseudomonas syringae CC1557 TaxID=1357279 RepID=W0N279_PSESX|nr:hypothetical protein N018_12465 [Pseudomonas syringae CC1557]